MEKLKSVTIGIINYYTCDLTVKCIKSIYESGTKSSFEICVVDNGSNDGLAELLKKEYPEVRFIQNERNMGFAYANNQIIKQTQSSYYLLLNSDTVVLKGALDNMVEFMDRNPDAGASGFKIYVKGMTVYKSCKRFLDYKTSFVIDTFLYKLFPSLIEKYYFSEFEYEKTIEVDQPMGAALIVNRKTINDIGLLDERFFFFFEEADWCMRMKQQGWKIYFNNDSHVIHHKDYRGQRENLDRIYLWHRGKYIYLNKYHGPVKTILVKVFVNISSLLYILRWALVLKTEECRFYWMVIKASV